MIRDTAVAAKISELVLETGRNLDASVALVRASCPAEEFEAYRSAIGKIMGDMLLDVMNPLYAAHPELKPPQLM